MNDLERLIFGATKDADDAFEESGETGTKCWIRDFFLPTIDKHGLVIITKDQKRILEDNAKIMARAADTEKADVETLRAEVKTLKEELSDWRIERQR